MKKEKCYVCKKGIDLIKEHYVLLGTYNIGIKRGISEQYFHMNCFKEFWHEAVMKKVKAMKKQAVGMFGNVLNSLQGISAGEKRHQTRGVDLNFTDNVMEEAEEREEEILDLFNDDGTKRKRRKAGNKKDKMW